MRARADAVIDGMEARGPRGSYTTNRFKLNSRPGSKHSFTDINFFLPTYLTQGF